MSRIWKGWYVLWLFVELLPELFNVTYQAEVLGVVDRKVERSESVRLVSELHVDQCCMVEQQGFLVGVPDLFKGLVKKLDGFMKLTGLVVKERCQIKLFDASGGGDVSGVLQLHRV